MTVVYLVAVIDIHVWYYVLYSLHWYSALLVVYITAI